MADRESMVDADALLALTADLRAVRERVERAEVSGDQRARWQRTLRAIAQGATSGTGDIERARQQLRRFVAQLDRTAA